MKALVKHLIKTNWPEIQARSRKNCHIKGMHSVMLSEVPGKTIRLFFAEKGHPMYKNYSPEGGYELSLGLHAHHCQLTLACVMGEFANITVKPGNDFVLNRFKYSSVLRDGKGGFERTGETGFKIDNKIRVPEGKSVFMEANEIHTVHVHKNEEAAWLVFEGVEDPNYDPSCYSTVDLTKEDFSDGYYQPMGMDEIFYYLERANLL